MNRRDFMRIMASSAVYSLSLPAASLVGCTNKANPDRPNFLFILADDERWDLLGCAGNTYAQTPHLDALAGKGIKFANNFVTTAVCACSRASFLTGMYTRTHGINSFYKPLGPEEFKMTYPLLLRSAGYRTGFVGKWGIGQPPKGPGWLPKESFDFFWGFNSDYPVGQLKDYCHTTNLLREKAESFLQGCQKDQPFCLSLSFTKPPHPPYLTRYCFPDIDPDPDLLRPKTANKSSFQKLPDFLKRSLGRIQWENVNFDDPQRYKLLLGLYYGQIRDIDQAVGRILDKLKERGLYQNTIVIFTSDNGLFFGEHGLFQKWLMYEESIRTPLIVSWPRLSPALQGRTYEQMTLNIDVAPTILDLAGIKPPARMQGQSLKPFLTGDQVTWRKDWFYEHLLGCPEIPPCEGVRTESWKYVRYTKDCSLHSPKRYEQLFDLNEDPYEEKNLAYDPGSKGVLNEMRDRWRHYDRTIAVHPTLS